MKKVLISPVLAILAVSVMAMAVPAQDDAPPAPDKVWICHFPGHTAPGGAIAHGSGHTSDADYAVNPVQIIDGQPSAAAHTKCDGEGGHYVEVAKVAAEKGHRAIRLEWYD